jgi:nicotinate-nucleotide adenylyltransferase
VRAEDQGGWNACRRLGIFGGSFDPIHLGHLHAARAAQERFALERVVFVPARQPPHKSGVALASGADRAAMLALALAQRPDWSYSELELERGGPSYTVDTLRELPGRLGLAPECKLFWIIGSDNLHGFERWKDVREILERAQPVAVARAGEWESALARIRGVLGEAAAAAVERGLVREPPVRVSATDLRAALAKGEMPEGLPKTVADYVRAGMLYRR